MIQSCDEDIVKDQSRLNQFYEALKSQLDQMVGNGLSGPPVFRRSCTFRYNIMKPDWKWADHVYKFNVTVDEIAKMRNSNVFKDTTELKALFLEYAWKRFLEETRDVDNLLLFVPKRP